LVIFFVYELIESKIPLFGGYDEKDIYCSVADPACQSAASDTHNSQAQQLVVTVDGVNVNLDWSAMPAATSYTLYYALTDYMDD
jgi:hypothetical protein